MSTFTIDSFDEYIRYKYVMENIKDIIWEMDTNLIFTFVSPNAKEASGYEVNEMLGKSMLNFLCDESKQYVVNKWKQYFQSRLNRDFTEIVLYDVQFVCKNGSIIWFEVSSKPIFRDNEFVGYIGTSRDVSEKKAHQAELQKYIGELKDINGKLEQMATIDMLTGVYNRRNFERSVSLSIDKKEKYGTPFSIIMFDIDNFKQVNDIFGHKDGDRILQELSAEVTHLLRGTDELFRWGGDEFIILLPEITSKNAYNVAEKVRKSVEATDFGLQSGKVTVSLGVGEYRTGESIDQFVSRIDNALLSAKSNGRNRTVFD